MVFADENFDGTNLPDQPVNGCMSAKDCAAACCSTPGCKAFTLNAGTGLRDCYLKSAITHRKNPGATSGVINGTAPPGPAPAPPKPLPPLLPASGYLEAVRDCGCDATGATDTTLRLQACIDRAYGHSLPRAPVLLPSGGYLVSDTIRLVQDNPGPGIKNSIIGDGINVVHGPLSSAHPCRSTDKWQRNEAARAHSGRECFRLWSVK